VYARTTTVMADPARMEQGIAFVSDEVWPAVRDLPGCAGMSMVVDRDTGKGIVTAAWETEEALRASAGRVMAMRDRATEVLNARAAPVVEEWEIAVMHRSHATHPGTCVRVGWSQIPTDYVDRALDFWRGTLLPEMERMPGFASASLMIDRAIGRGVTTVAFDSREAMESTREQAGYLRARSTQEINVEFLDVGEFELVMAHLHVPELV
jgi:hypothetical protein